MTRIQRAQQGYLTRFTPLSPLNAHNVGVPSRPSSLRWSNWNLLLLVPLLVLVTPVYNRIEPRLLGFPFFYWYQFLWIPIGVICTAVVYLKSRGNRR